MTIFYKYHQKKYDPFKKEDAIKLIYQAILGPNHLGMNKTFEEIECRVKAELTSECSSGEPLYEWISEEFLRVNIFPYSNANLDMTNLIKAFMSSSLIVPYNLEVLKQELLKYLTIAELADYNYLPISHSLSYKEKYLPHYLVINHTFLTFEMRKKNLENFLVELPKHSITSLDGKCASGKTTIASGLSKEYTIIHIDDFFLPPDKKTKERLEEVGGNIDYELVKENLLEIKKAWQKNLSSVWLRAYDCGKNTYYEKELILTDKVLLEGVYSQHKYFQELIDYRALMIVNEKTQLARIENRSMKERFLNEWIPLENKYFEEYCLVEKSDILI